MTQYGIDVRHVQNHRKIHQKFVQQVQGLWERRATIKESSATLVDFLTSCLGPHILGVDQSLERQIAAIEAGVSPSKAYEMEAKSQDNGIQALLHLIGKLFATLSAQNTQLTLANQNLEDRVLLRTQELEEANARLQAISRTDALLGIANRLHFHDCLERVCALALRGERTVGIIMIDVDCFKAFNDRYGHVCGDECLQKIAKTLQSCLYRSSDLVARYGGEEIVVLLPETTLEGAKEVAQRMVLAVEQLGIPHEGTVVETGVVTISAGVCLRVPYPCKKEGRCGSTSLLACADAALYEAKNQGRNRFVVS